MTTAILDGQPATLDGALLTLSASFGYVDEPRTRGAQGVTGIRIHGVDEPALERRGDAS